MRSPKVEEVFSLIGGGVSEKRPGVKRFNLLYRGAVQVARTLVLEEALDRFESDMKDLIAAFAPRRVFVHAGVVGWRGRAIVVPGRTFSGKTSLVRALVRAGATYYSDEFAVIDEKGRVHPYPTSLGVRDPATLRQTKVPITEDGGVVGVRPLPVGLVVLSSYREGAHWKPRRLSPGRGMLELLDNTIPVRMFPQTAMTSLEQVISTAAILKGARGEAERTAELILNAIE